MHSITSTTPLAPNQLLATAGYPAGWAIQGDVTTSVRDTRGGKSYSYRFAARPQSLDLPALYGASRAPRLPPPAPPPERPPPNMPQSVHDAAPGVVRLPSEAGHIRAAA